VQNGIIRLLFISPERLGNPYLLAALRPRMPLTAVVIDEAHCVAEWGHSFRPSYFRLGEILQRDISARSILALTATATKATEAAVCGVLRIPQSQVLRDSAIRQNLRLHVIRSQGTPCSRAGSSGGGSWYQVLSLFKGGPLATSRSSIVYCAWKSDADSLAAALIGAGVNAKAYHAGRSLQDRSNIEAAFSSGRLRVVVATVAFGMGIDIASVDAVVHATMPRSLEEYVQQIGRAGRDGSEGQCYAHLAEQDFISLRSLAYSGTVTKESVKTVLSRVFPQSEEEAQEKNSEDEEGEEEDLDKSDNSDSDASENAAKARKREAPKKALNKTAAPRSTSSEKRRFGVLNSRKLATEVDMQEESIEAMLGYLEADEEPYLRVLPKVANTAKISFYAAPAEQMAQQYPIVDSVLAICSRPRNGLYSVNTAKLAEAAQKPPGAVLQDLQTLAQQKLIGFEFSKETGPGFEILRQPPRLEDLADSIHARLSTMLRCQVARLDTVYRTLSTAMSHNAQILQESSLREALEEYFARQEAAGLALTGGVVDSCAALDLQGLPLRHAPESMLQAAKAALRRNKEQGGPSMSPMFLARVLHGMGSASMPRDMWCKRMGAFWGNMKNVDFTAVVKVCTLACKSFLD
jgi:ATP-dependent DNA helicase Q4